MTNYNLSNKTLFFDKLMFSVYMQSNNKHKMATARKKNDGLHNRITKRSQTTLACFKTI